MESTREKRIRQTNNPTYEAMIALAFAWYLIGLIVFYTFGQLGVSYWTDLYFIWDKAKDCLFIGTIFLLVKGRAIYWILIFSIIRFLWEIFSSTFGVSVNSEKAVAALFLILAAICLVILISESTKWRKQNLR